MRHLVQLEQGISPEALKVDCATHCSVHAKPVPENPELHAQVKDPGVLVQVAFKAQLWDSAVHSLLSVQVTPVPL